MFASKTTISSLLTTDIHSHILPGIDDGIAGMEEAVETVRRLSRAGLRSLWFTPHIKNELYPNTAETIAAAFGALQAEVRRAGIEIRMNFAAEYYIDEVFTGKLDAGEELLTLPGNYVLVEMSMKQEPLMFRNTIYELLKKGYKPILAHPERYQYYGNDIDKYRSIRQWGCLFQTNLLSLNGWYGKAVKRSAEMLMLEGLVDLLASDLHSVNQTGHILQFKRSLFKNVNIRNEIFSIS